MAEQSIQEHQAYHPNTEWDSCPIGHHVQGQLLNLPSLMMKDRDLILEKIESLSYRSNLKDEENERSLHSLTVNMNRIKADTDKRMKEVKSEVSELREDVKDVKELSKSTAEKVDRGIGIFKWMLGVFTAVFTALLVALVIAMI